MNFRLKFEMTKRDEVETNTTEKSGQNPVLHL